MKFYIFFFITACWLSSTTATYAQPVAAKPFVWIDADTGNELDDLFAITRLLKDTTIRVVGLSSVHFNNPDLLLFDRWNGYATKGLNTVLESQLLNEKILQTLNRSDVPRPMGADRQIGRAWGQTDPRSTQAVHSIIATAKALPPGVKLDIITMGALSNIASAVLYAPDILPKIRVFSLAARYNPTTGVWNKNEFNVRNDLNAFDFLLDQARFEWVIMPLDAALPLQFDREATNELLDDKKPIEQMLKNRWQEHFSQDKTRVMWDLALVEAYLHPEWATLQPAATPPENVRRDISVYTGIVPRAMADDFLQWLKK